MDIKSGVLGFYNKTSKNLITFSENIVRQKTYKRPINYKEFEKNDFVIVWGDETTQELFNLITTQETKQLKGGVGLLVYSTMNVWKRDEVRDCFILLKNHDEELYNSFGKEILESMDLKSTEKKWWRFW